MASEARPRILGIIRDTFKAGKTNLGIAYVCQIADGFLFAARKAELEVLDNRAELTGLLKEDDMARWRIFDAAVSELGFDPRQADGPAAPVDGKALLADLLA